MVDEINGPEDGKCGGPAGGTKAGPVEGKINCPGDGRKSGGPAAGGKNAGLAAGEINCSVEGRMNGTKRPGYYSCERNVYPKLPVRAPSQEMQLIPNQRVTEASSPRAASSPRCQVSTTGSCEASPISRSVTLPRARSAPPRRDVLELVRNGGLIRSVPELQDLQFAIVRSKGFLMGRR